MAFLRALIMLRGPSVSQWRPPFSGRFQMPLVSLLSGNHLRLQHVTHAALQIVQCGRHPIVILVFVFEYDLRLAGLTAALDEGDASDKFVHDVFPGVE